MSRIRANKITNKLGTGAIELEKGAHLPVGMGITGAGAINISGAITGGVITGSSFSGDGSGLIGVASTDNIITGTAATFNTFPVDINAGMTVAGVSTMAAITATTGTFSGNVSVGGTLTYEDVTNIDSVGIVTARAGIFVADSQAIHLGNAALNGDLRIYHDGASNHSFIRELGTGSLYIDSNQLYLRQANNNNVLLQTTSAGAVQIKYNGDQKIATSNTGVTVTGTVAATAFTGDASGLTGLPGITTEQATVSGGVVTLDLSKDDHKVVASGTYTVNVSGGTEAGSHTLRIENSGISTVGFSTYFKFPSGGTPSLPTASGAISLISFTVHKVGSVGVATVLLSGASVNFS
mgnify:FL=1